MSAETVSIVVGWDAVVDAAGYDPEEFYARAIGRHLVRITRDRLTIERGGFGPMVSRCFRCGWERSEHSS